MSNHLSLIFIHCVKSITQTFLMIWWLRLIDKVKNLYTIIIGSKDAPEIIRTSPTSSVVKFKPPSLGELTAHNEKT